MGQYSLCRILFNHLYGWMNNGEMLWTHLFEEMLTCGVKCDRSMTGSSNITCWIKSEDGEYLSQKMENILPN